jgi:hypothetical protein
VNGKRENQHHENAGSPRAGPADPSAGAVSLVHAGVELRSQTDLLRSAENHARELQAAAVREDDLQRVTAGLRERQLAVTEIVLDCLRGYQTMADELVACLSGQEAMSERLLRRVDALESQVASLADRLEEVSAFASADARATTASRELTVKSTDADRPTAVVPSEDPAGVSRGPGGVAEATTEDAEATDPAGPVDAPPLPAPSAPASGVHRGGTVARLLPFSRGARTCAVCQRNTPRKTKRDLARAGWTITGQWGVCPECRSAGWRLGDTGGLPFRQGTTIEE